MKTRLFTLETPRLILRPFEDRDFPPMASLLTNAEVKKTYMIPDLSSHSQVVALFHRFLQLSTSPDALAYAICRKDTGELVGFIHHCELDAQTGICEMGYVIHPCHKNNGYATEAFRAVIQELFRIGYHTVTACYFAGNTPSRRVMEKCGMRLNGVTQEIEYRNQMHIAQGMAITKPSFD